MAGAAVGAGTAMAAILRSGKFLRLFSGVARNLAASTGGNKAEEGSGLGAGGSGIGSLFGDSFFGQTNFAIQNVLPYLGVSDSGHAEDRFPTRLLSSHSRNLGRVTRAEIEGMIDEIRNSTVDAGNANLLSSQGLLTIRLCGTVLDQELPEERSRLVEAVWSLLNQKAVPITVQHYNALIRVYLENRHKFDPEAVVADMTSKEIEPDRETYQCLISRYCQEGNIDGASKILQVMKQKGFKVNENIFNSLIIGHSESGDMARAHGMLKVMRQWGLTPSVETYLTLACACARHGDITAMEKVISDASAQGLLFRDGDYLELLYSLCEHNHKEWVGRILSALHPETEELGCLASHMVVRLINAGHDDVAYNLVQFLVENSAEESSRLVSAEFLEQLVRTNATVTKLLWFLKDMTDRKINTGGLENLLDVAVKNKNVPLCLRLADILVAEGGKISKKQFKKLLGLAKRLPDKEAKDIVYSCVRLGAGSGHLGPEVLKRSVFPHMDNTWPELMVVQLEEQGLGRAATVTPLIEFLVGQGQAEAAASVAAIFPEHVDTKLKFLHSVGNGASLSSPPPVSAASNQPEVAITITKAATTVDKSSLLSSTPTTKSQSLAMTPTSTLSPVSSPPEDDNTLACLVEQMVEDDKISDLELLLESRCSGPPSERELLYTGLLRLYSRHRMIDRAIGLSRRLRQEQLITPEFYELLGELIESQYKTSAPTVTEGLQQQTVATLLPSMPQPIDQQQAFIPIQYNPYYYMTVLGSGPLTVPCGLFSPPEQPPSSQFQYYYPPQVVTPQTLYPTPPQSEISASPPLCYPAAPETPDIMSITSDAPSLAVMSLGAPPSLSNEFFPQYEQHQQTEHTDPGFLHRQLKRAVTSGNPEEGLSLYIDLERAGKVVNVTESSALIEQLVRSDMTHEATQLTQGMLLRNTHPLPKIFRFLLNKLATCGAVEDMLSLGRHLSTKIKKDVSYDNRLCNAYLSAGRGAEFLDILVKDLTMAVRSQDPEMLHTIQERFPRGGAMGLLDNHPELLDKFTYLASEFAKTGYVAPMNVLWTYHLIHDSTELADTIWENYVKNSNQIMFQKVCQVARATGNLNLAFGLVNRLSEAEQVTPGARGIAYSCLLDCLCATENHKKGFEVLKEALGKGVALEDVNRTALVRLKQGLEEQGQHFPFSIPPKNAKKDRGDIERSLSPQDWNEM